MAGNSPVRDLFSIFLRLGLTSFGGPAAHLGYFRDEFVERRRWLSDADYADLVGLCQFLPGPASSQVVMAIGLLRGGYLGAVFASLGFTLPSMVLMIGFGYGLLSFDTTAGMASWIHALKIVAVSVVAQAIWSMARQLCPDQRRGSMAVAAAAVLLIWPTPIAQVLVIAAAGMIGWLFSFAAPMNGSERVPIQVPHGREVALIASFLLLLGLSLLAGGLGLPHWLELMATMFRSGALIFGGGHVVLPLLEAETVPTGWVSQETFLAGYGAAQALPGPLLTFAAFLSTVATPQPNGLLGAVLATAAIFMPSFLLVLGLLPFWALLRGNRAVRAGLAGINAAVVGLLIAAFYDPVMTTAITKGQDAALALVIFALLTLWRVPAWALVLATGMVSLFTAAFA